MSYYKSIDIVVPSFRLNEDVIMSIADLQKPPGFIIAIFVIADNPQLSITSNIKRLETKGKIKLIINETNLGFSASRNKGIKAGHGKWILLLDDDVYVENDLLLAYASAIDKSSDAIGFIGVTNFPEPFNDATKALKLSGITSHFESALHTSSMRWAPTANIMLNRDKPGNDLFDENLKAGGEDIDLLVRNSLFFNEKYISVPGAVVTHPWWNNGSIQTKRLWRYGVAASEIAQKHPIKNYAYRDFTNTSETLLLLFFALPFAFIFNQQKIVFLWMVVIVLAEFITNWFRAIITGKAYSPIIALYLFWIKNCREAGALYSILSTGKINGFAKRIELGFSKPKPSPFRLNKWKIMKMILILVSVLLFIAV